MAPTNKNKRLRDNDQDSDTDLDNEHSYNSCNNWPRFLVVELSSGDLPLSKLSPFAVQKGFQVVAGTLESIKRLRDGSFLVECARKSQVMGLLKTTWFVDRPVHVSIHKTLNSSCGVIRHDGDGNQDGTAGTGCSWGPQGDGEEGYWKGPHKHPVTDLEHSRPPERDLSRLSKGEGGLVCSQPYALLQLQQVWPHEPRLLRNVRVMEKISMKVSVRDPSCALIAMVPTLHWLKIAWSRRRFSVSVLRNAYPFWKPDSWLKPRCRL